MIDPALMGGPASGKGAEAPERSRPTDSDQSHPSFLDVLEQMDSPASDSPGAEASVDNSDRSQVGEDQTTDADDSAAIVAMALGLPSVPSPSAPALPDENADARDLTDDGDMALDAASTRDAAVRLFASGGGSEHGNARLDGGRSVRFRTPGSTPGSVGIGAAPRDGAMSFTPPVEAGHRSPSDLLDHRTGGLADDRVSEAWAETAADERFSVRHSDRTIRQQAAALVATASSTGGSTEDVSAFTISEDGVTMEAQATVEDLFGIDSFDELSAGESERVARSYMAHSRSQSGAVEDAVGTDRDFVDGGNRGAQSIASAQTDDLGQSASRNASDVTTSSGEAASRSSDAASEPSRGGLHTSTAAGFDPAATGMEDVSRSESVQGISPGTEGADTIVSSQAPSAGAHTEALHTDGGVGEVSVDRPMEGELEQMVRWAQSRFDGDTSHIRMQLRPQHLGELELRLSMGDGGLTAQFVAESAEVQALIESSLSDLRDNLMQQGVDIADLAVMTGGAGEGNAHAESQADEISTGGLASENKTSSQAPAVDDGNPSSRSHGGQHGIDVLA